MFGTFFRMLTGLASLALLGRRKEVAQTTTMGQTTPLDPVCRKVHGGHGMPEERARFIAAFLKRAFRGTVTSIFCHEDRSFPEIRTGGKIEDIDIRVYKTGEGWSLTFGLNDYLWFMDGHVDIKMERDGPTLRVETSAPAGAKIRLMFMPEDGYGPIPDEPNPTGANRDNYDLWANARRALDRREYLGWDLFEFGTG